VRRRWGCLAVVGLSVLGCRRPPEKVTAVDAGTPIGPPQPRAPFELVAKNAELWAYRRGHGPYVVVRAHDFSRVGAFELTGDAVGAGGFPGARFCADGRFALRTAHPFGTLAGIWDASTGLRSVGGGGSEALGWSETCELVSMHVEDEPKRAVIHLSVPDHDEELKLDVGKDEDASVSDVTGEVVLVTLRPQAGPMGAYRLVLIDRKTQQAKTLPRTFLGGSSWARIDGHSFAITPSFSEGPFVARGDAELDPAAKAAFAPRPIPKASLDPTLQPDPIASGIDSTKNVVALFDGRNWAWWSLAPRRRLKTGLIEDLQSSGGGVRISFTPENAVTVAATPYGDVAGMARESRVFYGAHLAREVCPNGTRCASGNMQTVTTAVMSDDGAVMAVGSRESPPQDVKLVYLATGTPGSLPAQGIPRAFVDGHDKVLVGEEIWSLSEKKIVGHAPD
jgi:hypothetical protein